MGYNLFHISAKTVFPEYENPAGRLNGCVAAVVSFHPDEILPAAAKPYFAKQHVRRCK